MLYKLIKFKKKKASNEYTKTHTFILTFIKYIKYILYA